MVVMEVITALVTITLPIVATILLSGRQTQRIIQTSNYQTQRILEKIERCLIKIDRNQRSMRGIQRNTQRLLKKMHHCLLKLDFGFEANAVMHGWRREDDVSPERAKHLPEPKIYNRELRVCYYKSD